MLSDFFKIKNDWVIFFDKFSQNGNGDSIRPLAEELKKRHPDMKFFFCCSKKNPLKHIDLADEIIVEKTLRFNYVRFRAKYIISPMGFPNKGKKRKGQILVQTWHGSPLKKLYLSKDKTKKKHIQYSKKFKNTDIFCSQAEIHNNNLAEAFAIDKNVIFNTGLPRNDILFTATDEFRTNLKNTLKLPLDKKILFYCPTWRRADKKAPLPFNLNELKNALSNEYVLLMRSHVGKHQWVDENDNPIEIFDNEFCFNGGEYPEVTHLYTISDVLITDYSSSLFDYAITQKPQIFYAYDLEAYQKEFGLYFDYKTLVPGDIPTNTGELITAVKNISNYYEKYGEFYKSFREKYVGAENGTATKQVLDLMLEKGNKS